ncbi:MULTISPECIES: hypothetical protein [unclassified Paenibacillus]|uniref:hypothetical protein n=1 Tax=unclassified Paenibacillus TaxID=185978 RepID=UPI0014052812|nr:MULTISPECIES: hypothetical protein [unclassified Paenibacillus]NIK72073.1 hypothetical protein [Paenibacillus sp. BK720]
MKQNHNWKNNTHTKKKRKKEELQPTGQKLDSNLNELEWLDGKDEYKVKERRREE